MKKMDKIFLGLFFVLFVFTVNAQAKDGDAFIGKWDVLVEGTPEGDSHMKMIIEEKDDKIVCLIADKEGKFAPVDRLEIDGSEMTAYWNAAGYNVYLFLESVEDGKLEGSMMDMFDATATKIVDEK